jgi:hypothetical protein
MGRCALDKFQELRRDDHGGYEEIPDWQDDEEGSFPQERREGNGKDEHQNGDGKPNSNGNEAYLSSGFMG